MIRLMGDRYVVQLQMMQVLMVLLIFIEAKNPGQTFLVVRMKIMKYTTCWEPSWLVDFGLRIWALEVSSEVVAGETEKAETNWTENAKKNTLKESSIILYISRILMTNLLANIII